MSALREKHKVVLRKAAAAIKDRDHEGDAQLADSVLGIIQSFAATQAPSAPVDICAQMRALCSACGGTGDVHTIDGEWRGSCDCQASAPVARDMSAEFEAWAKREGLIQESHGIRSTSSACAVAQRAFDAGAALSVKAGSYLEIPEGWQLVPKEPTSFMTAAAMSGATFDPKFAGMFISGLIGNYRKMLAAAPTPPTTGEA